MAITKISTALISDNSVGIAQLAGIARGKIIYGDASGNPALLAVGANTYVLKSDGTDISWAADATVAALTSEEVQDIAGAMFTGNTETGITATYQDLDGTIDLVVGTLNQSTTGSAATLTTARAIAVAGNVTGTANFDGSAAISITTTLADDVVTLAKMAAGTDGNIISYDATGNPVAIATGTDGQVLTSTGAGSPPAFEDAAGGGASAIDGLSDAKSAGTNFANSLLLGHQTTGTLSSASNNVAVGIGAMDAITSGTDSVFIGFNAGTAFTSGNESVGIGSQALLAATTAEDNIAIGCKALKSVTTGGQNMAIGLLAGEDITTGYKNILLGYLCGMNITTGINNIAIGGNALDVCTTASENLAIGTDSLGLSTSGTNNVAVGNYTGDAITTGHSNTMLGIYAGSAITEGDYNVAIGRNALDANTTADNNVAVGWTSLGSNTTGASNTAVGGDSMAANTTGTLNVAVGTATLDANTSGERNTAVGIQALGACTTGGYNTAIGERALDANTTASNNTAVGSEALGANTTGTANVAVGFGAGDTTTTGSYNTLIGQDCVAGGVGDNFCNGLGYGITASGGYTVVGQSTADIRAAHGTATWATVSDQRYKKDIVDSTAGLSFINALQPRTFKYKTLGELPETFNAYEADSTEVFKSSQTQHGFIAQEVKAAIDADDSIKDGFKLWDDREDGSQEVAEAALIPVLVKALQEADNKIDALVARVTTLEG